MHRDPLPVLLIEDDPGDAVRMQTQLMESAPGEFLISVADQLTHARQLLKEQAFAAILLDLSLPDLPSTEILGCLKAVAPQVPVVVLIGGDDESLALHAVQHGAQDYLVKNSADGHVIAHVLRYSMQRQRTDEELRRAHNLLEQRVMERTAFLKATNRRLHEEIAERERTEEILRKERDFSSAILDTVGAIVVVLDAEGRIVRCNHNCEHVTGYLETEIKGRHVWDIFLEPQMAGRVQPVFREMLASNNSNRYENRCLTKDGGQRLIDWSNTVIANQRGEVEFVIATGIDITEKRAREEAERQSLFHLAHVSRLSTMGQMATEIAHELNQPLCAIASFSEACLRLYDAGKYDPAEVRQVLQEIGDQAQRAGEVIRRIRKFVRKEPAERIAISLNELVNDVVSLIQIEARWNQVEVRTELAEFLPPVKVDKILVEQVILNLVRNAIEAIAHAGSVQREVVIITRARTPEKLEVSVRDTGPGLPVDGVEKIFQPFYTTKPQGMGMGLSLSLSIVEAHAGELTAESVENGTIFRLILPAMAK